MRLDRENCLFCAGTLESRLRTLSASVPGKVDSIPKDQLLATPEGVIVESIASQLEILPLVLYEDRKEMEQRATKIDVSQWSDRNPLRHRGPTYVAGIHITVSLPFSGDSSLWTEQPNAYKSAHPKGRATSPTQDGIGYLHMDFEQPVDDSGESLKQSIEQNLELIRFYVNCQSSQIAAFNNSLPKLIRQSIVARKQELEKQEGIVQLLGIPLKRRTDAPLLEPIQIKRKLVKPLPPLPKSGFQAEPGISDEDYEHMLSVIRHEGRTFETTPKTFAVHDEEGLRDIMLAHLNAYYEGEATGETFRRSGKTDIRIEDRSRAAFVAECKVWRGPKELSFAIDQLLGYLTWRDCKAAIVVFNKQNAKFTELLTKIPEVLASHPKFRKSLGQREPGEWRYVLSSAEDELRQVIVNVFVFNLFSL
ncbi:MAG: hypothetical protein ACLPX5_08895 [Dissulfurispiraceae bacterium]